ncbi:MAG: YajQ family cyclic di-GMP-binding protein [Gammaproteobacteria bacterium]|nr:YajQ family cyclic di-GMP-binding protein [Gammaproteobacteria bacterium]MBI5618683.1 YajQ family cyclic di-GMP-binding protein [Gammaproteobacteria bacterium]
MPSFDVVSEINMHELTNAVDQANREIANRFDFKGTNTRVEQNEYEMSIIAEGEFQVKQVAEILQGKIAKRGIDLVSLEMGEIHTNLNEARQKITARHGIGKEDGKKILKLIKDSKLKVQAQIQDDQVRVMGKKRDDLQECITSLRAAKLGLPLQYTNFRD